ncbi:hypothetical protein [Metabacillus sp. B2-18]|uniref:hypothetical protein n=1 Tax=Metabacillus sp. B2-18 TaxID=2897333 RepID=UPI001E5586C9|nr:hypothetical protein [Metabacillus sp. B2-18]UGB31702.1 hypothetical protein LPC09_04260 [Metabacillus sp. B2-18]
MKVKALVSFAGIVTMGKNEVREIKDNDVRESLIRVGYVEEIIQPDLVITGIKTDDNTAENEDKVESEKVPETDKNDEVEEKPKNQSKKKGEN